MRFLTTILLNSMLPSLSLAGLVGGFDAIGPDNSLTNNLGGPTAVISGPDIFGAPAIQIHQDGSNRLTKFEVVGYDTPSTDGDLDWSVFGFQLDIFRLEDYLSDQREITSIFLGDASTVGLTLVDEGTPSDLRIVPESSHIFGEASPDIGQFGSAPTYLLDFDLTEFEFFDSPLEKGDYILQFVANHQLGLGGFFVSNSKAPRGHIPYWSQAYMGRVQQPRGIFRDQNPNNITTRLAINVYEVSFGDFDGDDSLSVADIDALTEVIHAGANESKFDMNQDGTVDSADHTKWVKELANTWFGDANLDGEFNSGDLIQIFQSGKYETDIDASWSEGDWNGDGRVDTSDLITAFQDGGYENGPVQKTRSLPEPNTRLPLLLSCVFVFTKTRRKSTLLLCTVNYRLVAQDFRRFGTTRFF